MQVKRSLCADLRVKSVHGIVERADCWLGCVSILKDVRIAAWEV